MKRRCVIPGCCLLCDIDTPYCSKYHQSIDIDHLYASSKGLFLAEGHWGPPWPIYLKPTVEEEEFHLFLRCPDSPEIGLNYEQNNSEMLTDLIQLSQGSTSSSNNKPERYLTPTIEEEHGEEDHNKNTPSSVNDVDDDHSWYVKGESQTKKRKNNEVIFLTPSWRQKNLTESEEIKEIEEFENKKKNCDKISPLKRKKRSQPILTLDYKISETSKPVAQRQLNISEYFRKKHVVN